MVRRVDLIDQFTELVVGADDPRRLAERTLEVVMSLLNGRSGAVFTCEGAPTLFASRGIDQSVLDTVPAVWKTQEAAFRRGETFYVADRATERRLPQVDHQGPASFAVAPVIHEEALVALVTLLRVLVVPGLQRLGRDLRDDVVAADLRLAAEA